jgi:hypothetical protein
MLLPISGKDKCRGWPITPAHSLAMACFQQSGTLGGAATPFQQGVGVESSLRRGLGAS